MAKPPKHGVSKSPSKPKPRLRTRRHRDLLDLIDSCSGVSKGAPASRFEAEEPDAEKPDAEDGHAEEVNAEEVYAEEVHAEEPAASEESEAKEPEADEPDEEEPAAKEPKYDNFYTPYNQDFYDSFTYKPLDQSTRQIRLLRIHPHEANEDDNAAIKCDLLDQVSLEECTGKFTAISYCAGDPKKTETVFVNETPFNAFANLGHALREARHFWKTHHADRELLLWSDQICINQSTLKERSHQVGFMGDIYAAAQHTLICLSTKENRGGGMAWLKQWVSDTLTQHVASILQKRIEGILELSRPRPSDEKLRAGYDSFHKTILGSPWWKRAWVRQELMRSADAYFLASHESLDPRYLRSAISALFIQIMCANHIRGPHKEYAAVPPAFCQACIIISNSSVTRDLIHVPLALLRAKACTDSLSPNFPDLLDNLENVHQAEASDPRDLVYSCLGYSSHSYGIEPDYAPGITLCDVSCQLACNIINSLDNLNILKRATNSRTYSRRELDVGFPSWVPDWRSYSGGAFGKIDRNVLPGVRQCVSFHSDDKGRSNRILHAQGVVLGAENTLIHSIRREGLNRTKNGRSSLKEDDEAWLLLSTMDIFIFRSKGQYHELVSGVWEIDGNYDIPTEWIDEVATLAKNNHPAVQTIKIC